MSAAVFPTCQLSVRRKYLNLLEAVFPFTLDGTKITTAQHGLVITAHCYK